MHRSRWLPLVLFTTLVLLIQPQPTHAAITWTGNIDPADPTTWTSSTYGYVGKTADGTLTVDDDSDLLSRYGYLGYDPGVTGEVTITGVGSTWNNGWELCVGDQGSGIVNIANGGEIVVDNNTYVARGASSTGTINFGAGGGSLTQNRCMHHQPNLQA